MDLVRSPDVEEYEGKASSELGTCSSDSSSTDLVKNARGARDKNFFRRGSFFSTAGLLSVVLIIALDNYIIGMKVILFVNFLSLRRVVNALPELVTTFNDLGLAGWYGSSYFLTLTSFQPAFGQLCTFYPIKTVYLLSIATFEIGSIVSASATSPAAFIIGRLISGAAAAGLWCGTLTLISQTIPLEKRHLHLSAVTSLYGVVSAAGSLLGGVFTNSPKLTWRFCFWINLRKANVLCWLHLSILLIVRSHGFRIFLNHTCFPQPSSSAGDGLVTVTQTEAWQARHWWDSAFERGSRLFAASLDVGWHHSFLV